jgi:hypothetical protein
VRRLVTLVLALLCAASVLEAQSGNKQVRQGFWIAFGLGAGTFDLSCDGCSYDAKTDLSGTLRMGGTLSQKVLIGGESMGWLHSENNVDQVAGALSGVLLFYPSATGGLYLKGGLGVAYYSASASGFATEDLTAFALSGGVGYDIRLGRNFSLTPYFNGFYGFPASYKSGGAGQGFNVSQSLLQLGLAASFH